MPRSPRYGNAREVKVAQWLEAHGYVTGSRRHTGGAGDVLAVKGIATPQVAERILGFTKTLLIEVKGNGGSPYMNFRAGDRAVMRETADRIMAAAWLAWWPPGGELRWIPAADWPSL